MQAKLTILVIDDNADDRELYRRSLTEAFGGRLVLMEGSSGDSGLAAIEQAEPDCVLLDYSLPGRDGIEVLKRIRPGHKHLPVILLTGQGNEVVAIQSMKEGAQDYITKAAIAPKTLGHIIQMAIERAAFQKRIGEQHEALEVFSRALAHDLKEPVRTISSFARMICDGEIQTGERDEYMRHIRDAGERMALLIDAVYSYTQLDEQNSPTHEIFNLGEAAAAAQANLAALLRERGATVAAEALPEVGGSRIQIIDVLQNLMSNAVSHSPKPVHIAIAARRDGETVRVTVRDNGPGIAPENLGRIFEPFLRLSHGAGHCGLGLAICRKIVEAHGGKIGCDPVTGPGASFFFILPGAVAAESAQAVEKPVAAARAPAPSAEIANVLLVDDRDDDILFTRRFLTGPVGMRCNFLVAHDGKEGLSAIRDRVGKCDAVDLVLVDINMPVMDGFAMLEVMSKDAALSRIPVVMCSGSTREKDKERSRVLGAIGYLAKPVRFDHLAPVIALASSLCLAPGDAGKPTLTRVA